MAVNAHRAFNCAQEQSFLKRLKVPEEIGVQLREARDEIRAAIREGLQEWKKSMTRDYFENFHQISAATLGNAKFRMQGGNAYHTANDTAQKPPQEIDLDDGMFLPVTYFSANGSGKPALISAQYFKAVETALAPLCNKRSWRLNKHKTSCIRVHISGESHVDIALYAVPDDEFREITENKSRSAGALGIDDEMRSIELAEDTYQSLSADQIMLAHRENGWIPSDPRLLEEWFKEAVAEKGNQVRFVSRYLKAWRDYEWEAGRLSSIALMSAVVTTFEEQPNGAFRGRDDLALLATAERLPEILSKRIPNPRVSGVFLDDGWTSTERKDIVDRARELHACLNEAIAVSTSPARTIEKIRERLGHRFPDDVTLIVNPDISTGDSSASVALPGLFKSKNADGRPPVVQQGDERYG